MIQQRHIISTILVFFSLLIYSCKPPAEKESAAATDEARTPVTIATISSDPIAEYIELNAVSTFLQKSFVKCNANGYLQEVNIQLGNFTKQGQVLFTVKTKESQSLGNAINSLDSTFRFSGLNTIRASDNGFITELNHHAGDYVQDGEQLAVISNMNSFVFLLELPYELRPYILNNKSLELVLPDGEKLKGEISSSLPIMDPVSQTQRIVLRVSPSHSIPENLIAKVRIIKTLKIHAISVPKTAVLTNETQDDFWVMKLLDSVTAVKVPIQKGIETGDRVEIISPTFAPGDKILVTGNYGLADTAKVKIVQ